jgi:GLPGLI family protein
MNYKISFLFLTLLCTLSLSAQNTLEVQYTQIVKDEGTNQSATLYYKDGKSKYVHSKGKKGYVVKNADGSDWVGTTVSSQLMSWYQDTIGCIFYKDYNKRKIQFREFFNTVPYISEEDFPTFKWLVYKEQKKILNYTCYKATTQFRGRNYTAWFTLDIPVQDGPWKFWGLPGLILDIQDDSGEVKFIAESVVYPSKAPVNFDFPTDGKKVDLATYRNAINVEHEKKLRAYQSKDYGRGVQVTVSMKKNLGIEKSYE